MKFDISSFDRQKAQNEAPELTYKPIPAGEYTMFVSSVEEKTASTGTEYYNIKLTISDDGEYSGKSIYTSIFLNLSSEKAHKINMGKLASLVQATVGDEPIQSIHEILDREFIAKVTVKPKQKKNPETGNYEDELDDEGNKILQNDIVIPKKKSEATKTEVKKETKSSKSGSRPNFDEDEDM